MKFFINSNVTGTKRHIFYDNGTLNWVENIDESCWNLNEKSSTDRCLLTLAKLGLKEIVTYPSIAHYNAMHMLLSASNVHDMTIPWQSVLPKDNFKNFAIDLVNQCSRLIENEQLVSYYDNVWRVGTELFSRFQAAHINQPVLDPLLAAQVGNMHVLMTFRPSDNTGFANVPQYNRFGTRTGRLTTSSGPDMLTLKKEYRNIVDSSWGKEGKIVMIDFCQLEPSIIMYEAKRERRAHDLYDSINNDLFNGTHKRSDIKLAVISSLYGQSEYVLMKNLGLNKNETKEFLEKISSIFNKRELTDKIKLEYSKNKYVVNHYGRCLNLDEPTDHMFVNTYVQSTGVDVSLLGFSKLLSKFDSNLCKPLFLIHDAIMLDCHNSIVDEIMTQNSVSVFGFEQQFSLKPEILAI